MAHSLQLRFFQQGHQQRQKVSCYLGVALVRRMNAVGLHSALNSVHVAQQKRQQWHMILRRQQRIGCLLYTSRCV